MEFSFAIAERLEVRVIGQCIWLSAMCFRSICKLSGGSTWVYEIYEQPEIYSDLTYMNLLALIVLAL